MEAAGSEGLAELFCTSPTNIQSFTRILAGTPAPDDKDHKDSQVSAGTPSLSRPPFRPFVQDSCCPVLTWHVQVNTVCLCLLAVHRLATLSIY